LKNKIAHIIKACLRLDPDAQKQLYLLHVDRLYFTISRYVHDKFFVENILQDVFLKIFKQLKTYDAAKGAFTTWSSTIAIRESLNHLRKNRLEFVPLENNQLDFVGNIDPLLANMEAEELLNIIKRIPTKYQLIFNLYEIDGYAHNEIATLLNITASSSRSYLARAKKMIQQEIGFCVN